MTESDPKGREEVRRHFDFFDDDDNGFIDFDEFTDILAIMGLRVATTEAVKSFSKVDTNCDGLVSFDEFYTWWQTAWYKP